MGEPASVVAAWLIRAMLCAACFVRVAAAQTAPAEAPRPPEAVAAAPAPAPAPLLDRLRAASLERLADSVLPTYYPAGAERRARQLEALVAEATVYLDGQLGVQAGVTLAVLDRERWNALITWQPYGVPGVAGRPPVAFMPLGDDGVAAQDALAIEADVDPRVKEGLRRIGLSYAEASRRYVDLVALHELGHVYVSRLGIRPNSRWLNELLATYVAYAFMCERQPEAALLWGAMLDAYHGAARPPRPSLTDFDARYFGVGPRAYVLYQAQFQRLVRQVYDAHGLAVLQRLREAFATPSAEPHDPADVVRRLVPHFPGAQAWMQEVGR